MNEADRKLYAKFTGLLEGVLEGQTSINARLDAIEGQNEGATPPAAPQTPKRAKRRARSHYNPKDAAFAAKVAAKAGSVETFLTEGVKPWMRTPNSSPAGLLGQKVRKAVSDVFGLSTRDLQKLEVQHLSS